MPKGDAKEGYLNTNAHLEANVALLMAQLAESRAWGVKLQGALACAIGEADGWCDESRGEPCSSVDWCRPLLDYQANDTALREMIEAAKAEEREAIIAEMPGGHSVDPQWVCDMIRARKG